MTKTKKTKAQMQDMPGHLFRRLHQIAVAKFTLETDAHKITPVQWASLHATREKPGLDQSTLARDIALDTSTIAGVIDRLEARGLIERRSSAEDRRVRILFLTPAGEALLASVTPVVADMQDWLLAPLSKEDQLHFIQTMQKLISRA
jgi:DNA-binding MarR family transcriptional regulator